MSHELASLLIALGCAGVELAPHPTDPARLRYRPTDPPPDLLAGTAAYKSAILGLLIGDYVPANDEAGYVLGERLGIAEGLGMPIHPGAPAWLIAMGESMQYLEARDRTDWRLPASGGIHSHSEGGA
jgi:hypothetical protein